MKIVTARPIDNDSFAPYGHLLDVPAAPGRYDFQAELFNGRSEALPNLLLASAEASSLPLEIERMERHPQSSQAFFPLEAARYIVMVCPDAADGGPDMARLDAFIVGSAQGINYNPGIWHHQLTALDGAAKFAALVWETAARPIPNGTAWRPTSGAASKARLLQVLSDVYPTFLLKQLAHSFSSNEAPVSPPWRQVSSPFLPSDSTISY